MMRIALALALAAVAAPAVTAAPAKPSATRDWTKSVAATAAGGFVMGNPAAPLKLVEYGSLACSHCAHFDAEGAPRLIGDYVKSGRVSYEFRNYILNPFDMAVSLIARCGGAGSFFPIAHQAFATQGAWIGRVRAAGPERFKGMENDPPEKVVPILADVAGVRPLGTARGLPAARVQQCLTDRREMDRLARMTATAADKYGVEGTPTFFLNGKKIERGDWAGVEAALKAAR